MKFNLEKALKDEEYARDIMVNKKFSITFDDYIFVLASIIGSGFPIVRGIKKLEADFSPFENLLQMAKVEHCASGDGILADTLDQINVPIQKNQKTFSESGEFVGKFLCPKLLEQFSKNNEITKEDILTVLKNARHFDIKS